LVAVTLGAETLATPDGPSSVPADELFIGPMLTTIAPGECVSAVKFPVWGTKHRRRFFSERPQVRFRVRFSAGAGALDEDGRCVDIVLGVGGVGDRALRLDVAAARHKARRGIRAEAVHAVASDMDASSDLHASASYRRRVAITLARRAVEQARTEAGARALKGAA
jgi:CO/xanthine dehydrogenase FAD-binding subunit